METLPHEPFAIGVEVLHDGQVGVVVQRRWNQYDRMSPWRYLIRWESGATGWWNAARVAAMVVRP